ncbi:cytochrome c, class II [Neisseria weaveri LMG 5135]|nr:cytochrome c, class II [Neisseria weaveri LMG 5135]
MGKMVKGEEAYEVEKFKTAAAEFAVESKKPFEHFQKDEQGDGDTLPVTWEKTEQFKAEEEKFHAAVEKLNTAAQSGNLEDIKVAYGEVGASCKACHDTFRRPK